MDEQARQRAFDVVRRARAIAKDLPERVISEATAKGYRAEVERMRRRRELPETGTQSKRTYYRRRAALNFVLSESLAATLAEQDRAQRAGDMSAWQAHVEYLAAACELLYRYPPQLEHGEALLDGRARPGRECPIADPKPKKSKRSGLARLPADWRQQMWCAAPAESPYRHALAVMHLCGARPSELQFGVQIVADVDRDGRDCLHISVTGAKRGVDGRHGREMRTITVAVDNAQAIWLWQQVAAAHGGLTVSISSPKRLADEVTRIGRKLWPRKRETVTPYSYRHQFAADLKQAFPEDWDTVAAGLGHSVPETQRLYGRSQQARPGGGSARFLWVVATQSPRPPRERKAYPPKAEKAPRRGASPG